MHEKKIRYKGFYINKTYIYEYSSKLDMYIYINIEFRRAHMHLKVYIRLFVYKLSPYVIMKLRGTKMQNNLNHVITFSWYRTVPFVYRK
jgi:hypothetical protein